ncbi:DsbA family protein [Pacificibacter sp. AS14]|uniref:DsbA family protein n=1 Tax=Pacificibacter sp. AS14 TaxID=3135785 RepID=UPI00317A19CA
MEPILSHIDFKAVFSSVKGLVRAFAMGSAAALMCSTPLRADTDVIFGEKVRQYLLENPQVILEAMDLLAAQQQQTFTRDLIAPYVTDLFETEMDLRMGAADASRVIVEFFDYNCAVCRANVPAMRTFIAANPDVAIVKKHLPILTPGSERVARFVLAARKVYGSEAYSNLHNALYAKVGPSNLSRLSNYASDLGLDADKIIAEMQDEEISAIIDRHRTIAIALQVVGTPTFATRDKIHVGAVTPEILAELAPVR